MWTRSFRLSSGRVGRSYLRYARASREDIRPIGHPFRKDYSLSRLKEAHTGTHVFGSTFRRAIRVRAFTFPEPLTYTHQLVRKSESQPRIICAAFGSSFGTITLS